MMEKIKIVMSEREYKKFLAYKEADKIVKSMHNGLKEIKEAREGKRTLKSAYDLAYEL
jgi:predicted nucleic acid-binding OB-fold protein